MKEKPRFFCDNCGSEVGYDAKACPHCGRFFASVRCPACGFSGEENLFSHGCPSCGYSAPGKGKQIRKKNAAAESLPGWIYFLSIAALLAALAVLAYVITR